MWEIINDILRYYQCKQLLICVREGKNKFVKNLQDKEMTLGAH